VTGAPSLTLVQQLVARAEAEPDRVALRQKEFGIWRPVTWAEYAGEARAVALGLMAEGIKPGDHVGILSENRKEWVIAQMGVAMARAVTVGVYPTSPAREVGYVVEHAGCAVVFCEDQEQADKLLEIRPQLSALRRVVVMDPRGLEISGDPWLASYAALVEVGRNADTTSIEDNLAAQSLEDVAMIVYTSGSTGPPKGAMITWRNIAHTTASILERSGVGPGDSCLSYLPLCHVAEQLITTCLGIGGGTVVNFGESLRTIQRDLVEVGPTVFLGVPRIWEKMQSTVMMKLAEAGGLRHWLFVRGLAACRSFSDTPPRQRTAPQRLIFLIFYWLVFRAVQNHLGLRRGRLMLSGAAPIGPDVLTFFRTIGLPVREAFGMTETMALGFMQMPDDFKPGTVGPPAPGVTVKIAPDGELLLRGEMVFAGYYRAPDQSAEALRDGWLYTGDLAEMDGTHVRIVGRKKEVLITAGGKNLSPTELENNLKASPYIKEAVVVGDRRAYLGALIQIDQETVATWAEIKGLAFTNFRSLVAEPSVRALVEAEVNAANGRVAQVAQIRRFTLLTKELDHDDDEMTATQKIRRSKIHDKYRALIDSLYDSPETAGATP
jgi:long-chain acyl-CoA synthetase